MANEHYVDNKEFLAAMIEFRKSVLEASETDSESRDSESVSLASSTDFLNSIIAARNSLLST